jgi:D-threo-aldose 1-dehydrogenase
MADPTNFHRPLGTSGIVVPPLSFRADVLQSSARLERTRRQICGEWFQRIKPPVFVDVMLTAQRNSHVETLARLLAHFDVEPEEVIINLELAADPDLPRASDPQPIRARLRNACDLLGPAYSPHLVTLHRPVDDGAARPGTFDFALPNRVELFDELPSLKTELQLAAAGVALHDWRLIELLPSTARFDFIKLLRGPTILQHPPEMLKCLAHLATRSIPVITANVFHGGFLAGGSTLDGPPINEDAPMDASLRTWRKAFTSLCHGHGVRPAHACIQFALGIPGVVAVSLSTSSIERVGENVEAATTPVPGALWQSMKEEGLLSQDYGDASG